MTIKYLPCAPVLALIIAVANGFVSTANSQTASFRIKVEREQVDFAIEGNPQHLRVQVYNHGGEIVYDSGEVSENAVVWNLRDTSGLPVSDGVYIAKLTITADSGKLIKRVEQVMVDRNHQHDEGQPNIAPAAEGNKVDGSGTPGKISKWTAPATIGDSLINEADKRIGIGVTPTGMLHVDEAQPASSASNGTPAVPLLQLSGGKGGDTTGLAVSAGAGADVSLFAGNGGSAPAGSTNGKGGNILLQPGSPGAGAGATGEQGKLLLAPLGGNVGIGTLTPGSKLTVFGRVEADNPGNGTGVLGQSDSGSGLRGVSTSGPALLATSGSGVGVDGFSDSNAGIRGSSTTGFGVIGISNTGLAGAFLGNVGISGHLGVGGASVSGSTLEVAGDVHSTAGYKFPDGSLQTTAGISAVAHDITLAGSGTQGSPLSVANMGIGSVQLANGAVTASKISVPLSLSGSDAIPILSVANVGSGAAIDATGAINSSAGYNIGGNRVLSAPGSGNTFAGLNAGTNNTGGANTFFGSNAGHANTTSCCNAYFGNGVGINSTGHSNAFFGNQSGESNTTGSINSFFGDLAGQKNTTGSFNTFFGAGAGLFNTTGNANAFFGTSAGSNTTASDNSFFGMEAGNANTSGSTNSFFGRGAGILNTTGSGNSFLGFNAGHSNTTESDNTFLGTASDGAAGITNATAVGFRAQVTQSSSLVLGSISGVNGALTDTNVGIGTTAPQQKLHVVGDVRIDGNLSKASGSFMIDHPLDPENKYLYHSFVESPDMMNIYNGNITTDQNGEAVVTLPEYFAALNKDFRYQLTVIGTFAQAIVADEIKRNRFTVKTSSPNVKVSWQVTGVRQDAYANKHRIPVEKEKSEQERGHYLHPEVFESQRKSSR